MYFDLLLDRLSGYLLFGSTLDGNVLNSFKNSGDNLMGIVRADIAAQCCPIAVGVVVVVG